MKKRIERAVLKKNLVAKKKEVREDKKEGKKQQQKNE